MCMCQSVRLLLAVTVDQATLGAVFPLRVIKIQRQQRFSVATDGKQLLVASKSLHFLDHVCVLEIYKMCPLEGQRIDKRFSKHLNPMK